MRIIKYNCFDCCHFVCVDNLKGPHCGLGDGTLFPDYMFLTKCQQLDLSPDTDQGTAIKVLKTLLNGEL